MEGFTADQACRYTGCTAHQLRYWDRIALVKPSVQKTGGRPGVRRLYSFRDLVGLKLIRSLLDNGMSLQRVRRAFEYLRKRAGLDEQLSEVSLVSDGTSVFDVGDPSQIVDALKHGQLAFCFALDQVATGTDARADHLYDRKGFVAMVRRVGSDLEKEMSGRPLQAAR